MSQSFKERLSKLGRQSTQETLCLQNTRLGGKYLIFDLIAVGSHSTIYYGIEELTGEERAFKFYNLKEIQTQYGFKEKEICKRFSNYEYSLMRKCDSIHLIKYYDIFEDRTAKIIVSEYCNMGCLETKIKNRKKKMTHQLIAIDILNQIIFAVKNIHKNCGILHKNLKSRNIFIQDGIYKLIDLGLPKTLEQSQCKFLTPQIMMKRGYDEKAETWSVGVLFHQILFGQLPDALLCNSTAYLISNSLKTIFSQKYSHKYHPSVIDFLQRCLYTNPADRMSWEELENHPMLKLLLFNPTHQPHTSENKQKNIKQVEDRISVVLQIDEQNNAQEFYLKKINLQDQIDRIEKEMQQSYQKLGYHLQLTQLQPISWQLLRNRINHSRNKQYKQLLNYYLQCVKVDFIYYDIITPLKKQSKYQQNKDILQFMYLLLSRCFFQMSRLKLIVKNNKCQSHNVLVSSIKKQTTSLYNNVKKDWDQIQEFLKREESTYFNIFKDKLNSFLFSQEQTQKMLILTGIQGLDFTKEVQIQYTFKLYTQKLKQIFESQSAKKSEQIFSSNFNKLLLLSNIKFPTGESPIFLKYLDNYIKIWETQDIPEGYVHMRQYIEDSLLQE